MSARQHYEQALAKQRHRIQRLERRSRLLAAMRLLVVAFAIAVLAGLVWWDLPPAAWSVVVLSVVAFAALVIVHARVHRAKDSALAAVRFHERGLARLDGRWTELPHTTEQPPSGQLFAGDLDLFGAASLCQLLDATETRFGQERLASLLTESTAEGALERQEAVRDLAARVDFREELSVLGALVGQDRPDPRALLAWAEGATPVQGGRLLRMIGRVLPLVFASMLLSTLVFGAPRAVLGGVLVVAIGADLWTRKRVGAIASLLGSASAEGNLARYSEMLAAIERVAFDAPLLRDLATHLSASGTRATRELARLERLVGFLEARNNEGFRLFLGPLLLWDLNFVLALETWRSRVGLQVRRWLQVVAEVEALASLAAFAFERPQCPYAELVSEPRFEAQGLSHPLLAGAVGNDLVLEGPGHALLVTGSNMSGKSTLLRAVGTNVVLAYAGAPVCATRLVLGPVVLATSMRVSDSLARGISHFLAEVQRLREVLDCAKPPAAVLFLLDEILHGTNSRERIIGAKAILRTLLGRGAMGLVSTHDLGLGDFASEPNSRVKNVHFQEQIEGETMTFDFRLREGLVHSSNALRLMKLVGIEVPLDPDAQ
jgi:hypothetical protein